MSEKQKSYHDVAVVVFARVYDEPDYGEAEGALTLALQQATREMAGGRPRAKTTLDLKVANGEVFPAVIRFVDVDPLSRATAGARLQVVPGKAPFRMIPEDWYE